MKTLNNQVTLIGNIGVKPTITELSKGFKIANFSLATHDMRKNREGRWYADTTWHQIQVKGQQVSFIENYGRKGTKMLVIGKIVDKEITNKRGQKRLLKTVEASDIKGL
ncbi:MAG: single-stranded DNA-binding protein [Crocinitomicaceae bacterium]|jgi:single-strand DNA-binding protein|nr:single-stranded DNA-binding protein [Crocinitomicaceae bacterium]